MTQNINRSPQIFLSYSHKDKQWVDIFVRKLKSAGVNIWFDENEIKPGDTWREKLEEGLRLSDSIIMILSPESVSSSNLSFELGAALGMGKKPVYLRKVLYETVTAETDIKKLGEKAIGLQAVAVLGLVEGVDGEKVSEWEKTLKEVGLVFRTAEVDDIKNHAALLDILIDLMLLTHEE